MRQYEREMVELGQLTVTEKLKLIASKSGLAPEDIGMVTEEGDHRFLSRGVAPRTLGVVSAAAPPHAQQPNNFPGNPAICQTSISKLPVHEQEKLLAKMIGNKRWRLENLYMILDELGNAVPMVLRSEQREFLDNRHNRNFVPKARKLGMSTIIVLDYMDSCLFPPLVNPRDDPVKGRKKKLEMGLIDLKEDAAHKKLGIIPDSVLNLGRADDSSVVRAVLIQNEKAFAIYAATQDAEWSRITSQP